MLYRRDFIRTSTAAALAAAIKQKADAAPGGASSEWRNKQSGMAYRRLGRTNFMVSEIVVGGLAVKPDNWEHVLWALDQGVNYLDTAVAYGRGKSEEGFAKVITARPRDSFFLNTKVSVFDGNRNELYKKIFDSLPESEQKKINTAVEDEIRRSGAAEPDHICNYFNGQRTELENAVRSELMAKKYGRDIDRKKNYLQIMVDSVEESLDRLKTDHVDVITCPHGASTAHDVTAYPEIFEAFERLKKAGKVRELGVSTHNDPGRVIDAAIETGQYSMALAAYNIINHHYVDQALENAKKNNFGVIAMKAARPVHNGRNNGTQDDPVRVEKIQKAVPGELKTPQKAYLWVLRNPNLSATISEMDTLEKMKENVPLAGAKS